MFVFTCCLCFQLWIYFIPSLIAGVLTLVAFWYKAPPTPPSSSLVQAEEGVGFFRELLQVRRSRVVAPPPEALWEGVRRHFSRPDSRWPVSCARLLSFYGIWGWPCVCVTKNVLREIFVLCVCCSSSRSQPSGCCWSPGAVPRACSMPSSHSCLSSSVPMATLM